MKALTLINGAADGELSAGIERYAQVSGFRTCHIEDLADGGSCLSGDVLYVDRAGEEKYEDAVIRMWNGGCRVIRIPASLRPFTYQGHETLFGPYEYEVLVYLLEHAGKAVSREEINHILPERKRMTDRNIDTHIKNIRRVLDMKKIIVSVRSVGYRVDPDEFYNWITGSR